MRSGPDRHLGQRLPVRLPEEELATYRIAAARAGVTLAEWVRSALADKLAREQNTPCT